MRRATRGLGFVAALLTALTLDTVLVAAAPRTGSVAWQEPQSQEEPTADPGEEITELRDRYSETYATDEPGVYRRVVWSDPVHYRDENSDWQVINTGLRRSDGRLRNIANDFGLEIVERPTEMEIVRLRRGDAVVGMGLAGVRRPSSVNVGEASVLLRNVLPEIDFEFRSVADGLKEDVILRTARAQRQIVYPLTLTNVDVRIDPAGDAVFTRTGSGEEVARIPKAWMFDSSGPTATEGASSAGATYTIGEHRGGPALVLTLDDAWLNDPARVYPVRVDPTYLWYQPESQPDDTYVATTPPGDRSLQANLSIGHRAGDPAGRTRRTYLHFNVDPNDVDYQVTAAQLNLYATVDPECRSTRTDVHRVTSSWIGSTMTGWYTDTTVPVGNRAASFLSTPDASGMPYNYGGTQCTRGGNYFTGTGLTTTVRGWVNDTIPNYGLMVRANDERDTATASYREYYSNQGGAANSLQRPYLEVGTAA